MKLLGAKHLQLLRKAEAFVKLAEEIAKDPNEDRLLKFHDEFNEVLNYPEYTDDQHIYNFIKSYNDILTSHHEQIESLAKHIAKRYVNSPHAGEISRWLQKIGQINPTIVARVVQHTHDTAILKWNEDRLDAYKLVALEDFFTEAEMLKFFQEDFNKNKKRLEEAVAEDYDTTDQINNLVAGLRSFYYSKKLPKEIIMRLIRQYDPKEFSWMHGRNISRDEVDRYKKFFNQQKYNLDDITYFMESMSLGGGIPYKKFQHMASNSSDQAKNVLQTALWWGDENTFILQPDMTPATIVDGEITDLSINPDKVIHRLSGLNTNEYPEWTQYMFDHKIIPYQGTFASPRVEREYEED